ncbi:MAG: tRNA (N(6)-L-threonylcarbamoyladenosine(37)-C(2))-methylthiotransferase MtaB [Chloroflexi bacterium RBG_16_50_9]|nr:MAG: tRNA (N(6)-L-threonylcarbamoyladenosine(37)-C(2))-methylthiotransferase MtaB [Chloroflexi bacterium RBG_16_50_9]
MDGRFKSPAVALDCLGCKLNQAEIEQIGRQLARAGYRLVEPGEKADIYILNTCTVTHVADRKSRHMLRLAHRRNPDARLIAIGCYAERARRELEGIDGVDLVLGNDDKSHLVQSLGESVRYGQPVVDSPGGYYYDGSRTRTFVKIQDGCRNFCAYCIVPAVRDHPESVPVERVVTEIKEQISDGYKEIVLTGTEIGAYSHDGVSLGGLLERIISETAVTRLRVSSLQPQEISPELIGLWRDRRLCPHFHLSLQSGSDSVLKRMKRRYTTADFQRAASLIREIVPDVSLTTDIIVGFPGETESEFQESLSFCGQMRFARIHVFPYSPRPGTVAASMTSQVTSRVKKQRSQQMLTLAENSLHNFERSYLGRTMTVLWEQKDGGIWSGLTGNYIRVYARGREDLTNKLLPVTLEKIYKDGVWGEVIAR